MFCDLEYLLNNIAEEIAIIMFCDLEYLLNNIWIVVIFKI